MCHKNKSERDPMLVLKCIFKKHFKHIRHSFVFFLNTCFFCVHVHVDSSSLVLSILMMRGNVISLRKHMK